MKALALVIAFMSVPAFAADYTPWPGQEREPISSKWVEQAQEKPCCKKCTKGQPCISASAKCKQPQGCAC